MVEERTYYLSVLSFLSFERHKDVNEREIFKDIKFSTHLQSNVTLKQMAPSSDERFWGWSNELIFAMQTHGKEF